MKRFVSFLLFVIITASLFINTIYAGEEKSLNWYCVRNKENKQPLADANMQFIEKYNGYYIDKEHGDMSREKVVYLTFDAGYENGNIAKILDALKEEQVSAAFFILENLLIKNTELVRRMIDEGHIVANHTTKHADVTKYSNIADFKNDLETLEKLCFDKTGYTMPKYFRCPEGRFSERSMKYADELGYKTVFWSFAYADWDNNAQMNENAAKEKILSNIHNGAIILLHPTSSTNAAIMRDIIQELKTLGYSFGTLDQLTGNI